MRHEARIRVEQATKDDREVRTIATMNDGIGFNLRATIWRLIHFRMRLRINLGLISSRVFALPFALLGLRRIKPDTVLRHIPAIGCAKAF